MKFKICVIMLTLNYWLQASELQQYTNSVDHTNSVDLNIQLQKFAQFRNDRCKTILLNSVISLDDSNLNRTQFKNIRNNLNKFCEDAQKPDNIKNALCKIQKQHQYCQYVSQSKLNNERIMLKRILNQIIDEENIKNKNQNTTDNIVHAQLISIQPSAPLIQDQNNK